MDEKDVYISTRQAAELLLVHESSVKRWCNAAVLTCHFTPGGHRRIPLGALLAFAKQEAQPCLLLHFGPEATSVWEATQQARTQGDFLPLVLLMQDYLRRDKAAEVGHLIDLLASLGVGLPTLCDAVIAPNLYQIGADWQRGLLTTGDEHRMTQHIADQLHRLRFHQKAAPAPANGHRAVALIGCAPGDEHELGALMVRLVLESAGWQTVYLGANVPSEEFAFQQAQHQASLVCISMVPPRTPADAMHVLRVLARMYDPSQPYRLVLGGGAVRGVVSFPDAPYPFVAVEVVPSMQVFAEWAKAQKNIPVS